MPATIESTPAPTDCEGRGWHYSESLNGCERSDENDFDENDLTIYDTKQECCMTEFGFEQCDYYDMCAPTASPSYEPTYEPTKKPTPQPVPPAIVETPEPTPDP